MEIHLDRTSSTGLSRQIVDEVVRAIRSGNLAAGERLPPSRELAWALGLNMHTVLAAYAMLAESGLVDVSRGRGTQVSADAGHRLSASADHLRDAVRRARGAGLSQDQIISIVQEET
ncbi:GntR family transcriptional regulator [Microbacterium gilvum]|uniref:GntR family transcriptional regulator n=1 Tax=Microbacterium gilvum TaxID=1336204 RepID=A0ABP9ASQ1_9MICO